MKILWISWKDTSHPGAGGAEVVMHELSKRMIADGHEVTLLTARHAGAAKHDTIDSVKIIRVGNNRYIHPFAALRYYVKNLRNTFDIVIEDVNTAAYFSPFFKDSAQQVLFYHQLAREIWFLEAPTPMSHIGYHILEPLATRALSKPKVPTITISDSTKKDLERFGFNPERIHIISEGTHLKPAKDISKIKKYSTPTMLSLGAMREMKRTLEQIKAFEIAKKDIPDLQLKVAGDTSGAYGQQVMDYIAKSPYNADIECMGRVSDEKKIELMQRSHFISVTSIKEGWGLIVTEAASQGTPAVVYDVDGLRDSVRNGKTGIVTRPTPSALAKGITQLLHMPQSEYETLRQTAWEWSTKITFEQSYKDLKKALQIK
jgi:glycosyltransferase involved in cell wall biosynthesis